MTDTYAPTAKPLGTAFAWATKTEIFVEIPAKNGGPPFICRYHKTAEGLAAALNIIIEHPQTEGRLVARPQTKITKVEPGKTSRAPWASEADRQKARDILKRLKIT